MIALPSIAFGGFSGSAKGVTARHVDGRSILSLKCYPSGYPTGVQLARRASLKMISKSWKELTDAQRQGWDQLADSALGRSILGQRAKLSGMNLYVRLNSNLILSGASIRSDAPIGQDTVPNVVFGAMYVNSSSVLIESINEENDDFRLVVKMSDAQSVGVSNAWSRTVVVTSSEETDWGELDLTDAFADVLGTEVEDGKKYFVEIYWIDSVTGFSGPVTKFSGIAGPDPIYGSASGENSRALVRVKHQEDPIDRTYFENFEYELSRGSVIGSVKGIYGWRGSRSNAYVEMDPAVAARFEEQRGYALVRSNRNTSWSINILEIEITDYNDTKRLMVAPTSSQNAYGYDCFDTVAPLPI